MGKREIIIAQLEHLGPDELEAVRLVTAYLYERSISVEDIRKLCVAAETEAKTKTKPQCSWREDDPNTGIVFSCIRRAVANGRCGGHQ